MRAWIGGTMTSLALSETVWMRLARTAWYVLYAGAWLILLASIPGLYLIGGEGLHAVGYVVESDAANQIFTGLTFVIILAVATGSLVLAWLLHRRVAHDSMALFVSYFLVLHAVSTAGPLEALDPFLPGIADFNVFILQPILFIPLSSLLYATFPDGRFVPAWTRLAFIIVCLLTIPITIMLSPDNWSAIVRDSMPALAALLFLLMFGLGGFFLYAQIHRYRRVSTPVQRQQTKWVLYGIAVWFTLIAISSPPWLYVQALPRGSVIPTWIAAASVVWALSTAVLPLTLAVSILRYRLYDIDLIINRTLVYGALTGSIVALYVLSVAAFGALFRSNLLVALLATAAAALVFQPLRARLQRAVNRLMYGERDEPYGVLTRLSRQLERSLSPEATLPAVVETIGQALKLPYVAVSLGPEGDRRVAASYGLPTETHDFPLLNRGDPIGVLQVSRRSPGESFEPQEIDLLQDLARQAGVAAQAVQLTRELQRARQELVSSREEERRRLRRDLHDGLGPTLAAIKAQAGAVRQLLHQDPDRAEVLVSELKSEIHSTIDEVRRLVYDLRPPALDELGLIEAIRRSAEQSGGGLPGLGPRFEIEAPAHLPSLPAAVEVAAFRIVQEAVTNVARHARADHCRISLQVDGELRLEVLDDGIGLPHEHASGVGLISMRERAEELGGSLHLERGPEGGTRLVARLPLRA